METSIGNLPTRAEENMVLNRSMSDCMYAWGEYSTVGKVKIKALN